MDGSLAKDKQSGSMATQSGGSQRVEMNDGNKTFNEEKLGVKAGAERNVTTSEDGQRNGSYKLTTGFSKATKDELKRGDRCRNVYRKAYPDRWLGLGLWNQ